MQNQMCGNVKLHTPFNSKFILTYPHLNSMLCVYIQNPHTLHFKSFVCVIWITFYCNYFIVRNMHTMLHHASRFSTEFFFAKFWFGSKNLCKIHDRLVSVRVQEHIANVAVNCSETKKKSLCTCILKASFAIFFFDKY